MKNLFSCQIIKQSFKSVWIWWLISIFTISINFFAFPSVQGVDSTNMLSKFAIEGVGSGNGIIFITICSILFANVLITSEIDKGTLAITLNTPTKRLQILFSKALVFIVLLLSISLFSGLSGTIAPMLYDIPFDRSKWWLMMALWSLYSFAVGGIAFSIGCWFNKSRYTVGITAVILGAFFLLSMFANIESFNFCKYLTLQTLFDIKAVIEGKNIAWQMITLATIGIPFYIIGTIKFLKKDLPL